MLGATWEQSSVCSNVPALQTLHGWATVTPGSPGWHFVPRKQQRCSIFKWSGWDICWLPEIVGGMAAMLAVPCTRCADGTACSMLCHISPRASSPRQPALLTWACRAGLSNIGRAHSPFGLLCYTDTSAHVHARNARDIMPDPLALCLVLQGTTISQLGLSRRQQ